MKKKPLSSPHGPRARKVETGIPTAAEYLAKYKPKKRRATR